MMFRKSKWVVLILLAGLEANAQVTAYPAQGQSLQQQQADKAACQDFAKSQTGFDQSAESAKGSDAEEASGLQQG